MAMMAMIAAVMVSLTISATLVDSFMLLPPSGLAVQRQICAGRQCRDSRDSRDVSDLGVRRDWRVFGVYSRASKDDAAGDTSWTRREWLGVTSAAGAAAVLGGPGVAAAVSPTGVPSGLPTGYPGGYPGGYSGVSSGVLCDASVSTWANDERKIHLLGTAHISSTSAELAGSLVRQIKPDVVFVELDAKRVARALPQPSSQPSSGTSSETSSEASSETSQAAELAAPVAAPVAERANPLDLKAKLVNAGSKAVGNAVKNMYSKLESEGFKAGDEFATSVREGLAIGSTIVLGDQDVELTLRRLTQALAKTDVRKLLSSDSQVEQSMEELLPENMKKQLLLQQRQQQQQQQQRQPAITASTMDVTNDIIIDKEEFKSFVETMKAKQNVKKIMTALQQTAPEIYQAMVAERDLYMAKGLDSLGKQGQDGMVLSTITTNTANNNNINSVQTTVAVMGMAHVDGVEQYLASKGWKEIQYPCPVI